MPELKMTPQEILTYLDTAITNWRKSENIEVHSIKGCYVDAFQSVRVSLFGELKPPEEKK